MQPIEINLATRPYRNDKPLLGAIVVLGLAAALFTVHNGYAYLTADARESALLEELAGHRQRMAEMTKEAQRLRKELAGIDMEALAPQAYFAQSILEERNFSWTRLFQELERVLPWNVRVTSIRPTFEAGVVRVELRGIAKNDDAYFHLQEVLQDDAAFNGIVPGDYQYSEATEEVAFVLSFDYRPQSVPAGADAERQIAGEENATEAPVEVLLVEEGASKTQQAETQAAAPPAPEGGPAEPAPLAAPSGESAAATAAGNGREPAPSAERGGKKRPGRARRARRRAGGPAAGGAATPAGSAALVPVGPAAGGAARPGAPGGAAPRPAAVRPRSGATEAPAGAGAAPAGSGTAERAPGETTRPPASQGREPRELIKRDAQGNPKWIIPKAKPGAQIRGAQEAIREWEEGQNPPEGGGQDQGGGGEQGGDQQGGDQQGGGQSGSGSGGGGG